MPLLRTSFRAAVFLTAAVGFFLAASAVAAGQKIIPDFSWRVWTQRDGLPSNEITSLGQSLDGYLYIGTPAGLSRFDGKTFMPVNPDDLVSLPVSKRGAVALSRSRIGDDLLIAPRSGGIVRLIGGELIPEPLPPALAQTSVESIFRENARAFWIGFQGGIALRIEDDRHRIFDAADGLKPNDPIQFARDGSGRVWLASGNFLARHENGSLIRVPVGSGREGLRIASSRTDGPWIVADEHLNKFKDGAVSHIDKINTSTGAHFLQALLEDSTGALWLGTRSRGLRRWTPDGEVARLIQVPEDISSLLEDAHGNIWAGTNGSGLIRVSPAVLTLFNRANGLLENHSLAVCSDSEGRIWFANRDGGVSALNPENRATIVSRPQEWENFSALSVVPAKDGRVWVSTPYGLHFITDSGITHTVVDERLTGENAPRVMFAARNGDVWFALPAGGVGRLSNGAVKIFAPPDHPGPARVRTFAEDAQARLWTGAEDSSLHRFDGEKFVPVTAVALAGAGAIQSIHFDRSGTGWIGTNRGGIVQLNTTGARRVSSRDGLLSDNVTQITSDDDGWLWLGSPTGISRIDIKEVEDRLAGRIDRLHPSPVGIDQGLVEATCLSSHQPAVWKTGSGILLFTTRQGVVAIDPFRERNLSTSLQMKIHSLACDGLLLDSAPIIRVPPRPRLIEIRYSPLNLTTPGRVRVRHRLTGFDDKWTEADKGGIAEYPQLPPGKYTFEIAARTAGVAGSESHAALVFTVAAAWWQSVWFHLLAGVLGIAAIVLAARRWAHRRLHKKLARLEYDAALEQERARIAKNIHDDLGAGLTRISLLTQSAQKNEGEAQLDKIYHTVSELTRSMDEIVWAVNPKNDDLESVANYIVEFAQGYLSDAGLRCRVLIPETLPARVITAQFRHHLFLTCKESLNNIVKHAQATDVVIQLDVRGDDLTLTIADNGIGLTTTAETPSRRNGLKNMRSRMESIGGHLDISAADPRGTLVTLTARLSHSFLTP
jgi:signal transduction histidine kinase/ligand-binding sensor domain-containing protein